MSVDPYKAGMLTKSPYAAKCEVTGRIVAILDFATAQRGLRLISQPSRAVRRGEVHELILTEEPKAGPDQTVNDVAYLGFMEMETGGILLRGDTVTLGGEAIGQIAGFDETHMPNHQNIVILGQKRTGVEAGLHLGDTISFNMPQPLESNQAKE